MLENDEIAGDVGDAGKAENAGDRENIVDVGEAGNAGDAEDKEVGKDNDGTADRRDQEDSEVGIDEVGDDGEQKAGKVGYVGMGDGVGIGGDPEDIDVGNFRVADGRKYDKWHATVEDVVDSDNRVIDAVDLTTDGVLADIFSHFFGPPSSQSNSPPIVIIACSG